MQTWFQAFAFKCNSYRYTVVGPAVDGEEGAWPAQFPAYRHAREAALEVVLQPGDVLFIPALWAHHVEALHGPSVAVNVFFRELPKAGLYKSTQACVMDTMCVPERPPGSVLY